MIGEIHLMIKSICIPLASIFTSYLPEGQFRLLSLKIFRTWAISHISSQNHQVLIGLKDLFEVTSMFLRTQPKMLNAC